MPIAYLPRTARHRLGANKILTVAAETLLAEVVRHTAFPNNSEPFFDCPEITF